MASSANVEQGKAFVKVLAAVLTRLVTTNDESGIAASAEVTRFHALRPPGISIGDYLERIHKYASCSAECFILALVYIDRLIQGNNLTLTSLNVHRVIITSVMLAAKFFDDQYFNNAYFAKVGGVPCPEMNSLELEFLFSINFSLHVSGDVYNRYRGELSTHMASMLTQPEVEQIRAVMESAPAAHEPAPLPVYGVGLADGLGMAAPPTAAAAVPYGGAATAAGVAPSTAASSSSAAAANAVPAGQSAQQLAQQWATDDDDDENDDGGAAAFHAAGSGGGLAAYSGSGGTQTMAGASSASSSSGGGVGGASSGVPDTSASTTGHTAGGLSGMFAK